VAGRLPPGGGALPARYLGIGLLGLRRLPASPSGSDAAWVTGLAQWALARQPTDTEFQAEWLALKPLYPRTDERWRELVARLLAMPMFQEAGVTPPAWWRGDPDFRAMARPEYRPRGAPLRSPLPEDCTAEIDRLHDPWARVEPRINVLMQRHRHFLNISGEPRFFVRAIHALGGALIRQGGDEPDARARKAQTLAREGLEWQPYDRHLWALWRDALAAEGALAAAELIGWELIRRDPEDVDARTQLATLLAEAVHRPLEAEALLRDTIAAFPQNAVVRSQLAELLIEADRLAEAEAVVDTAFTAGAADEATYAMRARLQSHRGAEQDAAATLRDGTERFPSSPVLRDYQWLLASGRGLRLQRAAQQRQTRLAPLAVETIQANDPEVDDTLRYGGLRRLRFRAASTDRATRQAVLEEVRAILRDNPAFAYAGVLAMRLGAATAVDTLPSFAVAFEQALAQGDRARLEELARQQPRLQALTLVARAVLGDESAAWLVEALLKAPPERDEVRPVSILRTSLPPILATARDLPLPQAIAANSDAVRRCLYDANEAALGDRIAA